MKFDFEKYYKNLKESFTSSVIDKSKSTNKKEYTYKLFDYVDLGLPSGNLWKKYNEGQNDEQKYGQYFKYNDACDHANKNDLVLPSKEDYEELIKNCQHNYTDKGLEMISNINGNSIIFPAVGEYLNDTVHRFLQVGIYWTHSLSGTGGAHYFHFDMRGSIPSIYASLFKYRYPIRCIKKVDMNESFTSNVIDKTKSKTQYDNRKELSYIKFEDSKVERICHEHGVYTLTDAANVTSIEGWFKEKNDIKTFNELEYFTGLKSIEDWAFYKCKNLQYIIIPDSVTIIGWKVFFYCDSLKSVNIPNSVTTIEPWAFAECKSLQSINIPNSVTRIGHNAFYDCTSLQSINIPNSVTSIGDWPFSGCYLLKSIVISKNCHVYNKIKEQYPDIQLVEPSVSESFTSDVIDKTKSKSQKEKRESVSEILFEDSEVEGICHSLGIYTYDDARKVSSIAGFFKKTSIRRFGEFKYFTGLYKVETDAFFQCKHLEYIELPDTITEIGWEAFGDCISLKELRIPSKVKRLYKSGFFGSGIKKLYISRSTDASDFIKPKFNDLNNKVDIEYVNESFTKDVLVQVDDDKTKDIKKKSIKSSLSEYPDHEELKDAVIDNMRSMYATSTQCMTYFWDSIKVKYVSSYDEIKDIYVNASSSGVQITHDQKSVIVSFAAVGSIPASTMQRYCYASKTGRTKSFRKVDKIMNDFIDALITTCQHYNFVNDILKDFIDSYYSSKINESFTSGIVDNHRSMSQEDKRDYVGFINFKDPIVKEVLHRNGIYTVYDAEKLTNEDLTKNCTKLDQFVFSFKDLPIESFDEFKYFTGLRYVPYTWFAGCNKLKSIIIPNNIKEIDGFAFNKTTELKNIIIPKSVEKIYRSAFSGSGVENIVYEEPSNDIDLESSAFVGCNNLKKVVLPTGLSYMRDEVYWHCENLEDVYIPENSKISFINAKMFKKTVGNEKPEKGFTIHVCDKTLYEKYTKEQNQSWDRHDLELCKAKIVYDNKIDESFTSNVIDKTRKTTKENQIEQISEEVLDLKDYLKVHIDNINHTNKHLFRVNNLTVLGSDDEVDFSIKFNIAIIGFYENSLEFKVYIDKLKREDNNELLQIIGNANTYHYDYLDDTITINITDLSHSKIFSKVVDTIEDWINIIEQKYIILQKIINKEEDEGIYESFTSQVIDKAQEKISNTNNVTKTTKLFDLKDKYDNKIDFMEDLYRVLEEKGITQPEDEKKYIYSNFFYITQYMRNGNESYEERLKNVYPKKFWTCFINKENRSDENAAMYFYYPLTPIDDFYRMYGYAVLKISFYIDDYIDLYLYAMKAEVIVIDRVPQQYSRSQEPIFNIVYRHENFNKLLGFEDIRQKSGALLTGNNILSISTLLSNILNKIDTTYERGSTYRYAILSRFDREHVLKRYDKGKFSVYMTRLFNKLLKK